MYPHERDLQIPKWYPQRSQSPQACLRSDPLLACQDREKDCPTCILDPETSGDRQTGGVENLHAGRRSRCRASLVRVDRRVRPRIDGPRHRARRSVSEYHPVHRRLVAVSRDHSSGAGVAEATQLVATPAQLFTGFAVGLPSLAVVCAHCHTRLHEGDEVSVYAYRPVEDARWYLGRSCCPVCAPETVATPTLGTGLSAHRSAGRPIGRDRATPPLGAGRPRGRGVRAAGGRHEPVTLILSN
jgi:hypothetical protein